LPISIDHQDAERVLLEALAVAKSTATLPIAWLSYTRTVFGLASKTWTPALGTLLLAKAVCEDADALSLKAEPSDPRAYSARGLCHAVLVPAAVQHGFSIRNTGREPLNNLSRPLHSVRTFCESSVSI
jgi:SacI restriction endonuclease